MSGYRNPGFADGFLRGFGFVEDLRQRDKDNEFRNKEFGLREAAAGRDQERFDQEKAGWLSHDKTAELANLGYQDQVGQYGINRQKRDVEAAGMLTPEQAGAQRNAGHNDVMGGYKFGDWERQYKMSTAPTVAQAQEATNLDLQGKRESIATSRHARSQPKLTDAQREYAFYASLSPEQRAVFDQMKGRNKGGMTVQLADGTIISEYAMPGGLSTPTKNAVQKDVISAEEQIAKLKEIGPQIASDYLTYVGRGRALVGGVQDKLGVNSQNAEFNADRSAALQGVEQFFNAYRRDITGAAAAQIELEALKKAVINSDIGPQEFQRRYNALMGMLESGLARNKSRLTGQEETVQPAPRLKFNPATGRIE